MKDFSQYKNLIKKSPFDKRDIKFRSVYPVITLPVQTNNREYMLKARDQGNQGACAAFAGAGMQQYKDTKEINLSEYLSPQFIYNNREDLNEEGMYNRDLMKIIQKQGVCLEKLYPYNTFKPPTIGAVENALNHRHNNYAQVETLEELKAALYIKGPCVIAVPVYNFTTRMWYQRPGDNFLGGHDMLAVDYDDNERVIYILNSWGDDFGEEGYIKMSYDDFHLAWEWWSSVDLQSQTTTQHPFTTQEPPKPWIKKYWWFLLLLAGFITVGLILIL